MQYKRNKLKLLPLVTYGSDHVPIKIGTLGDLTEKCQEFRPCYQSQEDKAQTPWCGI